MKKTSLKIMGVALTLAILACLVIGVLPVGALAFNTPNVSLSSSTISAASTYTVNIQTSTFSFINPAALTGTLVAAGTVIPVTQNDSIAVTAVGGATTIATTDPGATQNGTLKGVGTFTVAVGDYWVFPAVAGSNVTTGTSTLSYVKNIQTITGAGSITTQLPSGTTVPVTTRVKMDINNNGAATATVFVPAVVNTATNEVTAFVIVAAQDAAATSYAGNVQLIISGLTNPSTPATYTLNVKTSVETTYITSAAYTIAAAAQPLSVSVYNSANLFVGSASGTTALKDALAANPPAAGYFVQLSPGLTYSAIDAGGVSLTISANNVTVMPSTGSNVDTGIRTGNLILTGTGDVVNNLNFSVSSATITPINLLTVSPPTAGTATVSNCVIGTGVTISGADDTAVINLTNNKITGQEMSTVPAPWTNASITYTSGTLNVTGGSVDLTGTKGSTTNSNVTPISGPAFLINHGTSSSTGFATISGVAFTLNTYTDPLTSVVYADRGIQVGAAISYLLVTNCTFTSVTTGTPPVATSTTGGIAFIDNGNNAVVKITNSTFTYLEEAVNITGTSTLTFTGNTVSNSVALATTANPIATEGALSVNVAAPILTVTGNKFASNASYSVNISSWAGASAIAINGNDFTSNTLGFWNQTANNMNVQANYWGAASGPTNATLNASGTGDILKGTAYVTPLDALDTNFASATAAVGIVGTAGAPATIPATGVPGGSGVVISGLVTVGSVVTAEKLATDPVTATPPAGYTVLSYFDVFVSTPTAATTFTISFYVNGLSATTTQVWFYSALSSSWIQCTNVGIAGTGNYAYVTVGGTGVLPALSDMQGTPFVVINSPTPTVGTVTLLTPTNGSAVTGTNNIAFTWTPFANATSYEITITGGGLTSAVDVKNLVNSYYQFTQSSSATLTAGLPAFWNIKAYNTAGTLVGQSITYTFTPTATVSTVTTTIPASTIILTTPTTVSTTVTATVTNTSTVGLTNTVTQTLTSTTTPPAQTVTSTSTLQPITSTTTNVVFTTIPTTVINTSTVVTNTITQPITQITPSWIWGIIGIGAVLIIVVIVLVVRTRRTV